MRLRLFLLPKAFRALSLAMLALATVFMMQIAVSGGAFADEGHHHHSGASHAVAHAGADVVTAKAVAPAIPLVATPGDCNGNHHNNGPSSKSCCASACCAAALAWEPGLFVRPTGRPLSNWTFTAQFVVLKQASGLDRPPDFTA